MQFGRFDSENKEYFIYRNDTPRPWSNYLGSKDFGAVISNHGSGYTFYKSAAQGRLTRFRFNSAAADYCGKFIYLKDKSDGDFWSNGWMPVKKDLKAFKSEARHGTGYTRINSEYRGVSCESLHFIPLNETTELTRVRVKNESQEVKKLSLYPFVELQNNWNAEDDNKNLQFTQYISSVTYDEKLDMLDKANNKNMPVDPEHFENKDQKRHLFCGLSGVKSTAYQNDLESFFGAYGNASAPEELKADKLNGKSMGGDMPCFTFQVDLDLAPGEEKVFTVLFGVGQADNEGKETKARYDSDEKVLAAWQAVRSYWHERLQVASVELADKDVQEMFNLWSPYNNLMTFYWSRTASFVYAGERDGLGYRDSVQDLTGTSLLIPEESGDLLELLISGQCSTGGALPVVKPFNHQPGKEKQPDGYRADDCLWLFNAIPTWVKETGHFKFYEKIIPYADQGEASVLAHMRRAIEFNLERSGKHGLPCGLEADWNDCLRLGETGESVFVAFQLRLALAEYIDICERMDKNMEIDWAQNHLKTLDENIDKHCWDGEWYLRAYRYDGLKFGSRENPEGSIFMNPQAWAILSGHASSKKAKQAMHSLDEKLSTDYGVMVCTPPYVETDPQIALARLMEPGMKENGGVFNHTQGWAILAAAKLGMKEKAWEYLKNILPSSFNDKAEIRQVEPYAVCQSTHSSFSPRYGSGRVPWLSGSAVWNYYAMAYGIFGIQPEYNGLALRPCLPKELGSIKVQRQFRGKRFFIDFDNQNRNEIKITLNGEELTGDTIPVELFKDENQVKVEC